MRTRSSSTAQESGSNYEVFSSTPHGLAAWTNMELAAPGSAGSVEPAALRAVRHADTPGFGCADGDEGLLHDARNLISAVGLYCDLLSMPHVLRPEHRHYADELRLLGTRSAAMIERLMERQQSRSVTPVLMDHASPADGGSLVDATSKRAEGLRAIVERCSGLLDRVADGHAMEILYGEAAGVAVRVPAESVERILVNLVRNASAALGTAALAGTHGGIRIGVGVLPGPVSGMRPWPFQRVCLVVEDRGRGMTAAEVEQLLGAARTPPSPGHGIGFRVVRELAEASGAELSIVSRPGEGTRVEIAWPVAQPVEQPGRSLEAGVAAECRRSA